MAIDPISAGLMIGTNVLGGIMGGRSARRAGEIQAQAAREASQAQLQAAREANQLTAGLYRSGVGIQAPQIQAGQRALAAIMSGMGLGPVRSSVPGRTTVNPDRMSRMTPYGVDEATLENMRIASRGDPEMSIQIQGDPGDIMYAGGTPGFYSDRAAPQNTGTPVGTYVDAQGRAVDAQGNPIVNNFNDYGIGDINPGATQEELAAAGASIDSGFFSRTPTMTEIMENLDPGYAFRKREGELSLAARRAAVGNRFGGQALKDIQDYAQNLASTEGAAALDRYQRNRQQIFDRLAAIAGYGNTAGANVAGQGAQVGSQMGSNITGAARIGSEYLTSGAASRAAGTVGSTRALVGGVNEGLNNYYFWNSFRNPGGQPYRASWDNPGA